MTGGPQTVEEIYRTSAESVRARHSPESARDAYRRYVDFVSRWLPPGSRILDLGCGTGWSSSLLGERGYRVVGADLNARAFDAPRGPRLQYLAASMNRLPLRDGSLEGVCLHEALEHGTDPQAALGEMVRVLRPGGVAVVVGPNLLSPLQSLRAIFIYSRQIRPRRRLFVRDAEMPRHPFGNTLPEIFGSFASNLLLLGRKLASRDPSFTMRVPDSRPPFHSDNDASYVCNPVDLQRFFGRLGFEILATSPEGRPAWTALLAGGTWIAARKPGGGSSPR